MRFPFSLMMVAGLVRVAVPVAAAENLRPPAVPLVMHDPYLCIWSKTTGLADSFPIHWTGKTQGMTSLVRLDGKVYRLMGTKPAEVPAMKQTGLEVTPTRTIYTFEEGSVKLKLTFLSPILPEDLDVASRPVTYVTWDVQGAKEAEAYFDCSGELAVDDARKQSVTWSRTAAGALMMGNPDQPVLVKKGDDRRIDWGHTLLAGGAGSVLVVAEDEVARAAFVAGQALPGKDDERKPRKVDDHWPVMAARVSLSSGSGHVLLGYDDEYSIKYFSENLRPYWRRNGMDAAGLLAAAEADRVKLAERCAAFDTELMADLEKLGGRKYAQIAALSWRQAWAGNKLAADSAGRPLLFPKENNSNGCIATVDVIYPMAPIFLLMGADVAKAQLVPVLDYGSSPRWRWPFAPHDLGTYPHATAQVYGGGERTEDNQMPVEESGNMILLVAAVAKAEGNAAFAEKYWPALSKWAAYLKEKGLDPEKQLCTDDFAGHLAHNVNLSVKAILALGAYGQLCETRGLKAEGAEYLKLAREYAVKWMAMAEDGDHYRLAFDKAGTWSQKYNLVWDRILGLDVFPDTVNRKEMEFYKKTQKTFGLPLDNRSTYTKLDWTLWTATLSGEREDFEALAEPVWKFLNETPDRIPMTDWYHTHNAKFVGFIARPVVGGVFLKCLDDATVWKKWFARGAASATPWAPLPARMVMEKTVVPTSEEAPQTWKFTTDKPAEGWEKAEFTATGWKEGQGGFGRADTPGAVVKTEWKSDDIWLRRSFDLPAGVEQKSLRLRLHHDDGVEVYLNGVKALAAEGFSTEYEAAEITPAALVTLKPAGNVLAIHCHQDKGGQYIDAGLVTVTKPQPVK